MEKSDVRANKAASKSGFEPRIWHPSLKTKTQRYLWNFKQRSAKSYFKWLSKNSTCIWNQFYLLPDSPRRNPVAWPLTSGRALWVRKESNSVVSVSLSSICAWWIDKRVHTRLHKDVALNSEMMIQIWWKIHRKFNQTESDWKLTVFDTQHI